MIRTPWPTARTVIAAVALIFLLYFGREFFVPVAVALVLSILGRPVVRWLERRRLRPGFDATLVLLLGLAASSSAAERSAGGRSRYCRAIAARSRKLPPK